MKEDYNNKAKDSKTFYRELNDSATKFHVVAEYFGRGMLSDVNTEEESSEPKPQVKVKENESLAKPMIARSDEPMLNTEHPYH